MAKFKKKTNKKSKHKNSRSRGLIARVLPYLILIGCIGGALLSFYAIYLDKQVRQKFEGARWTLPAKVYADPITLYSGLDMSQKDLVDRLSHLGYQPSDSLKSTGTYSVNGNQLSIYMRGFDFWDGYRPSRKLRLSFDHGAVKGFNFLDDKKQRSLIRLDPALIGSIYPTKGGGEDRILVKLDEVPELLTAGLIAVEDRNFMTHWGVSLSSIARAVYADLRAGAVVQGGSTLTQQLIKNFYLTSEQTLTRKAKEALMAVLLEMHYSKAAIMQTYLNEIYLGQDGGRAIHGFGLASYFYFHKPLTELRPREIALLVAMVKGPSYYNPRRYPERAKTRRNLVLDMFHERGLIGDKAWKTAKESDLGVGRKRSTATARYPGFIKLVEQQLLEQYDEKQLTEEGLRVFTTLDQTIQDQAQEKLTSRLKWVEKVRHIEPKTLQAAAVVTSVEGGKVLALISGRKAGYAGYNRALETHRHIGSTIKPFVYLTALEQPDKYNVLTPLDDTPITVDLPNGDTWTPHNFSHVYHGKDVPLYYALEHSYNVATVRLSQQVGLDNVIDTLQAAGYNQQPLAVPSLALGAVAMSPFQVAQIYNTLAGGGYYTPLTAIRAVTTSDGESLTRHELKIKRVFDSGPSYILSWIMHDLTKTGTGQTLRWFLPSNIQVAGKTGTTDGGRDSWFSGFSSDRVAVVWVGNDQNAELDLTGAAAALPVWGDIMNTIGARGLHLTPPSSIETVSLRKEYKPGMSERDKMLSDRRNCRHTLDFPFIKSVMPEQLRACQDDILESEQDDDDEEGSWLDRFFN